MELIESIKLFLICKKLNCLLIFFSHKIFFPEMLPESFISIVDVYRSSKKFSFYTAELQIEFNHADIIWYHKIYKGSSAIITIFLVFKKCVLKILFLLIVGQNLIMLMNLREW